MARYPLLDELRKEGWVITKTRRHFRATHPDADGILILPVSPSDRRNDANCRAIARRMLRSGKTDERREET